MEIAHRSEGDVLILTLSGELDAENFAKAKEIEELLHKSHSRVVLNLDGVRFVNSTWLGFFIKAHKLAREQDGDVVLAAPSKFFQSTIKTLGIDRVFHVFATDAEAVRHFEDAEAVEEQHYEGARVDAALLGSTELRFALTEAPERFAEGRILSIYEDGLTFKYPADPDRMSIDPEDLQLQTELRIRFQQPFLDRDRDFEMKARISFAVDLDDAQGATKFRLTYTRIEEDDRRALEQFVKDQDTFRREGKPETPDV